MLDLPPFYSNLRFRDVSVSCTSFLILLPLQVQLRGNTYPDASQDLTERSLCVWDLNPSQDMKKKVKTKQPTPYGIMARTSDAFGQHAACHLGSNQCHVIDQTTLPDHLAGGL